MTFLWLPWTLALMAAPAPASSDPAALAEHASALAPKALAGDLDAIAGLRELGQPGLDALQRLRFTAPIEGVMPGANPLDAAWPTLIDRVARQQYASASGLYWYTDLDKAVAAAKKQGKPILSLRLLGGLDEVLSCANSRFFRVLLYPDPAVRTALHDGYVLHWETVRKAPKITIDFGDGRVLTRTVTGNSLHYLMDANGRVVDALPGVNSPAAFIAWLEQVSPFAKDHAADDATTFSTARLAAHRDWKAARLSRWQTALAGLGLDVAAEPGALRAATNDDVLLRLARTRPDAMRIDPAVKQLLQAQFPSAIEAAPLAITKSRVERPMLPWLANLVGSVARDEIQNDLVLHTAIHDQFAYGALETSQITQLIYAQVFLTPLDDPFMGLAPADVFTAIPSDIERREAAVGTPNR